MDVPEPFHAIHRCLGRRSLPDDWPRAFDCWDAFDEDGGFLFTLDYQALSQLLDGKTFDHPVVLQFEDNTPDGDFTVPVGTSFELTICINLGGEFRVENPDRLVPKSDLREAMAKLFEAP